MLRNLFFSMMLGVVAVSYVVPAFAGDKPAEHKCDKAGKECKDGADCKAENCPKK